MGKHLSITHFLSSLCIAILLLAMVPGCSDYKPTFKTGVRQRTPQQVADDILAVFADLDKSLRVINDAQSAKEAAPKVTECYDRMVSLFREGKVADRTLSAQELQQFETQYTPKFAQSMVSITAALDDLNKNVPGLAPDLLRAFMDGKTKVLQAQAAMANQPAEQAPAGAFVADSAPDSSCWAVWLLSLIVMAACIAFLCRDGIWNNALQLVNVVFAGLLSMNFYEWVARYTTKINDDVHTFVPMIDFLALWTCFVLFVFVLRAVTEAVSKVRVRFLQIIDRSGGAALSVCIGWVMVCFTLASLHVSPLAQYPMMGAFQPQSSMFLGMLAPDREWLGFTKYQSAGAYCRTVDQDCSFPPDFIEQQMERRYHIERYIRGNVDHAIRINPQFMKPVAKPAG
jgi:hypothetical protein